MITDPAHKINLLIDAIRDIGIAAGVLREDIGDLSGPEALMFAEDTANHVRAMRETCEKIQTQYSSTLPDQTDRIFYDTAEEALADCEQGAAIAWTRNFYKEDWRRLD